MTEEQKQKIIVDLQQVEEIRKVVSSNFTVQDVILAIKKEEQKERLKLRVLQFNSMVAKAEEFLDGMINDVKRPVNNSWPFDKEEEEK